MVTITVQQMLALGVVVVFAALVVACILLSEIAATLREIKVQLGR